MKKKPVEQSINTFKENNQLIRMSEALNNGISKHQFYELVREGKLIREERGIYRFAGSEPLSNPDFLLVSKRVPKAVICLISALYHHQLTTQIPDAVYIAIPRTARFPKLHYPPLQVFRLSDMQYRAGIETFDTDGSKISIYGPEKTVADCFKFRNRIGMNVAIEALKNYMSTYSPNANLILDFAGINRVEKIMKPYLEALL